MLPYRIHPEAAEEHARQIAYFESIQPGLGRRYHVEVREGLLKACEAPQRCKVVETPAIRKLGLPLFHFDLLFREVQGVVEILAIAPHRRRPGYWRVRT